MSNLRGPARRVAIAGLAIVLLFATTLGIARLRYGHAQERYDVVERQAQTQRILGEMRGSLLDRVQAFHPYGPAGELPDRERLEAERSRFDPLVAEMRREGHIDEEALPKLRQVSRLNDRAEAAGDRAIDAGATRHERSTGRRSRASNPHSRALRGMRRRRCPSSSDWPTKPPPRHG